MTYLNAYSINSVTLRTKASTDALNNITYTNSTIVCRVEFKTQLVKNQQGEDVKSEIMIYFENDVSVTHGDKVIVNGNEYAIIKISDMNDFSLNHIEVFL